RRAAAGAAGAGAGVRPAGVARRRDGSRRGTRRRGHSPLAPPARAYRGPAMSAPGTRRRLARVLLLALAVVAAWGWWALRPYRALAAWEAPCESNLTVSLSADGTRLLGVGNTGAVDNIHLDSY